MPKVKHVGVKEYVSLELGDHVEPSEDVLVDPNDPATDTELEAMMAMPEDHLDNELRSYGLDVVALNVRLAADEAVAMRLRQLEPAPAWLSGQWVRVCEPARLERWGTQVKRAKARASHASSKKPSSDGNDPEECDRPWGVYSKALSDVLQSAPHNKLEVASMAVLCH